MDMDGGEEEKGETKWREEHGSRYTNIWKIANGNLLCDSGNSNWGSVTTWRAGKGWDVGRRFKKESTYVYLWLIHVDVLI